MATPLSTPDGGWIDSILLDYVNQHFGKFEALEVRGRILNALRRQDYERRTREVVLFKIGGAPSSSCAAWLSALRKADAAGEPCPTWDALEAIAPSIPAERR